MDNTIIGPLFADLSVELRNQILKHVLWSAYRLRPKVVDIEESPKPCIPLGILRTSKRVCEEALQVLYGENIFSFIIPTYADTVGLLTYNSPLMKHVDLEYLFLDYQCIKNGKDMDAYIASYVSRFQSVKTFTLRLPRWPEGPFPGAKSNGSATAAALAGLHAKESLGVVAQITWNSNIEPFLNMLKVIAPIEEWVLEVYDRAWIGVTNAEIRARWFPTPRKTAVKPSVRSHYPIQEPIVKQLGNH